MYKLIQFLKWKKIYKNYSKFRNYVCGRLDLPWHVWNISSIGNDDCHSWKRVVSTLCHDFASCRKETSVVAVASSCCGHEDQKLEKKSIFNQYIVPQDVIN